MQKQSDYIRELKQAHSEDGVVRRTHVGGQALLEGIMMRGRYNWAVAVRTKEGDIYVEEHDLASGKKKNSWMYLPIIRGCTALIESMTLSFKALDIAAKKVIDLQDEEEIQDIEKDIAEDVKEEKEQAFVDATDAQISPIDQVSDKSSSRDEHTSDMVSQKEDQYLVKEDESVSSIESSIDEGDEQKKESKAIAIIMGVSMVFGVILAVGLFIVLPVLLTNIIVGSYGSNFFLWNIVDGIIRVIIFIIYIWIIGRLKDTKRMFSFHGAEHKTIHAYEHGVELTVENIRPFPTLHVRCGTAFMIMTLIVAIIVFTVVPLKEIFVWLNITNPILQTIALVITRIIFVPLIAGLSYELTVKWAGSRPNNAFVKVILWPGMQMQRLTTNQPDDDVLEVAIAAMNAVLAREEKESAEINAH